MTIHRQHSETEINELYGQSCSKIIAVANKDEKTGEFDKNNPTVRSVKKYLRN